jgi:peptidoglycan/LPS O-acetylase OafA/YrhL
VVTAGSQSTRGGQRSTRATAKLAWSLCGLALALLAAALLVLLIGRPRRRRLRTPGSGKRPTC